MVVYIYKQSAHKFIENTLHHNRTNLIDVRHRFERESVEKGLIKVKYEPTNETITDVQMKSLSADPKFISCFKEFGLSSA